MLRRSPADGPVAATLAANRLGTGTVMMFILAGAAPLTVAAGVVPTAYAVTGLTSIPAAFLLVAAVLAVFAVGYVAMARHIPNAGAFYAYITAGLGRPAGVAAALTALVAYTLLQVGLYGMIGPALASYAADNFGLHAPWWVWAVGVCALVAMLGLLRVDLSGRLLGVLSVTELAIIVAVSVRGLTHPAGGHFSAAALNPAGLLHPAALGPVLAVAGLGFTGFEVGPVYGEEARDRRRTIARATFIALTVIGAVYAAASWSLDVHYGDQVVPVAQSPDGAGMLFALSPALASASRTLFLTSLLAAALAFHNATNRYMWALGREHVLPAALGRTARNGVPRAASITQSISGLIAVLVTIGAGWDPVDQLFFAGGTTGGLGILILLAATSVAVIGYFRTGPRHEENVWRRLIAPGVSAVLLAGMIWLCIAHYDILLNVTPGSTATWLLPGLYAVAAAAGLGWALIMRRRQPAAYAAIGRGATTLATGNTSVFATASIQGAGR